MFKNKSILLILIAALLLLASPALAQDHVNKLVVRNNLKDGRQFEAVFQPGSYVLHPRTANHEYALFGLRVVSNPSQACFIRGGHNGRDPVDEADRLFMDASKPTWSYFELGDTCFLRFEIFKHSQGAVNIRKVKKVKTIELNADWQKVTFGPGRWSPSSLNGEFEAHIQPGNDSPSCSFHTGSDGMHYGIWDGISGETFVLNNHYSFILDQPCVLWLRAVSSSDIIEDGSWKIVLEPVSHDTATFVKSG